MSEANNVQKEGILTGLGGSLATSALMTRGFGSLPAIKTAKAAKKVLKVQTPNAVIKEFIKKNTLKSDSFTRSIAMAKNYEKYSQALAAANKAQKTLAKVQGGKIPLLKRILNLGKSKEEIIKIYAEKNSEAANVLKGLTTKLKNGEEILETTLANGKTTGSNILGKSLKQNLKGQFKDTVLNPINLLYAVSTTFIRLKDEAIPVFKEKGVAEGIKQTGISIGKSVVDVASNLGFSFVLKTIGMRIGSMIKPIAPVAASIGGAIGDVVGTFVSNRIIAKAFGEDKPKEAALKPKQEQKTTTLNVPAFKAFKEHPELKYAQNEKIQKALYI